MPAVSCSETGEGSVRSPRDEGMGKITGSFFYHQLISVQGVT